MDLLLRRIREKEAELIGLTQDLVRIPTINPPGCDYRACAELIGDRLQKKGFQVIYRRGEGTPGDSDAYPRENVIARWDGKRPGPCLHFNGHIDVVPVGEGWTRDPFAAEVSEGKIFGRGTCDMKGGIAAAVIAVESLIEVIPDLPGAIEISGTADEETGGYGGVAYLAENGFFSKPRVDHVIIPEPLNVDRICLGHRGVWWAEIETLGRIAHGSMPFLGDSAILHMNAFLQRLEKDLMPRLAERKTAMPVVPQEAKRSTLNINSLHGGLDECFEGLPAALVADSCRMVIDRRFLIEEDLSDVQKEFLTILDSLEAERPGFRYKIRELMSVQPTMTDASAPVVLAIDEAIGRILGRPAKYVVSPGTYDQKHIARLGKLHDCIAYGPGILDLAHQPDEFISVDDMLNSAQVMALAALSLLQGES